MGPAITNKNLDFFIKNKHNPIASFRNKQKNKRLQSSIILKNNNIDNVLLFLTKYFNVLPCRITVIHYYQNL